MQRPPAFPQGLDAGCPINWADPINQGLAGWWLAAPLGHPSFTGGRRWLELCGQHHLAFNGGTVWHGPMGRPGGWGSLDFDGAGDYVTMESAVVTAMPLTITCWFRTMAAPTVSVVLVSLGNNGATGFYELVVRGAVAGDPLTAAHQEDATTTTGLADSATGTTAGRWHFGAGVFTSATSRTVYLDGVVGATDTTSIGATTPDFTTVGALRRNAIAGDFDGLIDDVRIYSRGLTAAEIAAVRMGSMRGYPNALRRQSKRPWFTQAQAAARRTDPVLVGGGIYEFMIDE